MTDCTIASQRREFIWRLLLALALGALAEACGDRGSGTGGQDAATSAGGAAGVGGASGIGGSTVCATASTPEEGFIACGNGTCPAQCDLSKGERCCWPTDTRKPFCASDCGCDPNDGASCAVNIYYCDGPEDCSNSSPYCCGGYLSAGNRHPTTECSYYENCKGDYALYLPLMVCHTSTDCGGQNCRHGSEIAMMSCGPM